MKWIAPDYYPEFACIADRCRHSCCVGWEIEIDADTLARYRAVRGPFGDRLSAGIDSSGDSACFRLDAHERCPFLNADGLCDVILNLGEDALCQICDDHPRFRSFLSDRIELGLGLCCEAAAQLILGKTDPVRLTVLEDDGEPEPADPAEEEVLSLRSELFALAQDRSRTLDARMDAILQRVQRPAPAISLRSWAEFYRGLEQLDPEWDALLSEIRDDCPALPPEALSVPCEQLLVCLLYRHIPGDAAAEVCRPSAAAAFAVHATRFIRALCAHRAGANPQDTLAELARMYSSEIEYSQPNLDALLSRFQA